MDAGINKIIINTNLRHGIPMENVNKIAGPFVEAGEWLNMADIILQFKCKRKHQVYSKKDTKNMMMRVMEVVDFHTHVLVVNQM